MGSGFSKQKKQMKAFQDQMAKMQEEMKAIEVTGSASDLVKITLSGSHEVKKVEIDPKCVDANAVDALEDLVHAALQDAMKKVDDAVQIPGIPGFGF
jgi:nucleoid-associated protein EbfC